MTLFLVCEEGYIQAGKIGEYKGLFYNSLKITQIQKKIMAKYKEAGYDTEDLAEKEEVEER